MQKENVSKLTLHTCTIFSLKNLMHAFPKFMSSSSVSDPWIKNMIIPKIWFMPIGLWYLSSEALCIGCRVSDYQAHILMSIVQFKYFHG